MAASAKRNTIKLDASLIRLSPSRIVTTRLGAFTPCNTEVAATASGGEIIPPNKNPRASEKSGMIALERNATAAEVKITNPKARREIGCFHFQNSCHEVFHAAAYNNGGRKMRNTRSGCNVIEGIPGTKLIISP